MRGWTWLERRLAPDAKSSELCSACWDEEDWRRALFRQTLSTMSFAALVGGTTGYWSGALSAEPAALLIPFSAVFWWLSHTRLPHTRLGSWAFTAMCIVLAGLLVPKLHWAPFFVSCLCLSVVTTGLLSGHAATRLLIAIYVSIYGVTGIAVHLGYFAPKQPSALDPQRWENWLRSGAITTLLAFLSARTLHQAIQRLRQASFQEHGALNQAQEEHQLAERSREERRTKEENLRNTLKLQTVAQLGQGFAHLFNNVLTVLRAAVEEARSNVNNTERQAAIQAIADAAELAISKTRDLLMLSRPHNVKAATLCLRTELKLLHQRLSGRLRDNVQVILDLDLADGIVGISPSWFDQILMNLLLNAEQAMALGGVVRLSLTRRSTLEELWTSFAPLGPGEYLVLSVTDQGHGMRADSLLHACEPFFTTKGRDAHDGLGLTVVLGMLRSIGGVLELTSGSSGTTVRAIFPVLAPKSPAVAAPDHPDLRASPSTSQNGEPSASTKAQRGSPVSPTQHPGTRPTVGAPTPIESARNQAPRPVDTVTQHALLPLTPTADWQGVAAQHLLLAAGALFGLGLLAAFAQFAAATRLTILVTNAPALTLVVIALLGRRWPTWLRCTLLTVSVFLVGSTLLVLASFMSPAGIALITLSVLLSAELLGQRASVLTAVAAFLVFALGGFLHSARATLPSFGLLDPALGTNWWRVALFLALALPLFSWASLHVVLHARGQLSRVQSARQHLETMQHQRRLEAEASLATDQVIARLGRMDVAGKIIGMVAHDLNNSLQSIVGWLELLATADSPSATTEALDGIDQSTDYAESLIQQLQLGPPDPVTVRSIDVGRELLQTRSLLRAVLGRKTAEDISLHIDADEDCYVEIPAPSLRRILLNLVTNARDAMSGGGRCVIQVARATNEVELTVTDTGAGMPPETLAQLSQPFFTTKGDLGTGLGLHSVHQILAATRGVWEITSHVGQGTRVALRWPAGLRAAASLHPESPHNPTFGKARVLLVEDQPLVRQVLQRVLERAGYSVVPATDGTDAARQLLDCHIDVLCTDAVMPGCPVADLISTFLTYNPGGPVILMSGHLPSELSPVALAHSTVTLLSKPFAGHVLLAELERRLA